MIIVSKKGIKMHPNSLKNLKHLDKRTKAERRKIAIMGGKANKNNPNASLGQKLRFLREGGFTDKTQERLFELYQNSNFSKLDMLDYLEKLRRTSTDAKEKIMIYAAIKDTHKLLHGTKEHDRRVGVAVLHLTPEEKEQEIFRLLGTKKTD